MAKQMCLSIQQPFVEQIMRGDKRVEYRTWRTRFVGWLGIHASKGRQTLNGYDEEELAEVLPGWTPSEADFGHLVGFAWLAGCCRYRELPAELQDLDDPSDAEDYWCWLLKAPTRMHPPMPAKGNATLFYLDVEPTALPSAVRKGTKPA